MSIGLFVGLAFLSWGPPIILAIFTVFPYPYMFAAFFATLFLGVLSYFCTSILWLALDPIGDATVYVFTWLAYAVITELFRSLSFAIFQRFNVMFHSQANNAVIYPASRLHFALSSGLAFGISQQLLLFGSFLIQSAGEGALFPHGACADSFSTGVNAAVEGLCLALANVGYSVAATHAYGPTATPKAAFLTFFSNVLQLFLLALLPMAALYTDFCLGTVVVAPLMVAVAAGAAAICLRVTKPVYTRLAVDHED